MANDYNINKQSGIEDYNINAEKALAITREWIKLQETATDNLNKGKKATEESAKATKAKATALTEVQKLEKANTAVIKKLVAGREQEAKTLEQSRQIYAAQKKEIKEGVAAKREELNAIKNAEAALKSELKTTKDVEKQNKLLRIAVKNTTDTTEEGVATIERYNAIINKNDERINKNSDKRKQATQNVGNYTDSIKKAITELESEGLALKKTAAFQKEMIASGKLTAANQDKLQKELQETNTKLAGVTSKLRDYGAEARNGAANASKFKSGLISTAKQIVGFTGAAALATLAIRKISSAVIDARADVVMFEKEFTNVLTLLDESDKLEFKDKLEGGAISIMSKYGLAIEDVNKSLFDTISAGVPAGEAIEFLNNAAGVAVAGNAELSSVIDGATTIMNAYGSKAGSTTDILNSFFAAQVKGKTTVGLLAANIGKVASQAASANIPVTELMSTAAGLTKFMGGTEESMTALSNVMNAIIKPSDEAAAAFAKVRLSTGEVGIETGITAIKQNGLLETILQVADAYEQDNDVLAELIPNIRAFKGIAGLTAESIAELKQNTLDLNDAEASSLTVQNALTEQMNTRESQTKRLEAASKALNIERDKSNTGIRALVGSFRELRIERKLELAEVNRNKQAVKEFRAEVQKEIAQAKEFGLEKLTRAEAYRIVTERNAKAEAKAAEEALERVNAANAERASVAFDLDIEDDLDPVDNEQLIDFDALKKQQAETKKATDAFLKAEKDKKDAINERSSAILKQQAQERKIADEKLKIKEAYYEESDKLASEWDDLEEEGILEDIAKQEERAQAEIDLAKRVADEKKAIEQRLADEKVAMVNNLFNFGNEIGNRQIAELEKQTDAEGNITQEAADKIAAIKKKQAIADKAQALFNIAIDTARAVAAVTAEAALAAPFLIPAIIANGALQAATVVAQPIPQFKNGVDNFGGGFAILGDGGEHERVTEANGNTWMSANVPTLYNLSAGSTVENQKQIQANDTSKGDMYLKQLVNKRDNGLTQRQFEKSMTKMSRRESITIKLQGK